MISVTSGETTQTIDINPEFMTREVLDSGVKITPVTKTESSGSGQQGTTTTEIDGIVVEMMAGLLPTSHEHLDGGGHTDANGIWVEGDYTLEMVIMRGNTVVYGQRVHKVVEPSKWFPLHRSFRYNSNLLPRRCWCKRQRVVCDARSR